MNDATEGPVLTYKTTITHTIDRLEVGAEIDDVQDTSWLKHPVSEINAADSDTRMAARADAIRLAQHGRSWGFVTLFVRSGPDGVVRAALGMVDSLTSDCLRHNERANTNAAHYFGEILSELVDEARAEIAEYGDADAIPVVDHACRAPVDGAALRDMAATAVDWWAR